MQVFFSGLVGAVASVAVWVGLEQLMGQELGWLALAVGLVTGLCVNLAAGAATDGGYLRGALATALCLVAIVGGQQAKAMVMESASSELGTSALTRDVSASSDAEETEPESNSGTNDGEESGKQSESETDEANPETDETKEEKADDASDTDATKTDSEDSEADKTETEDATDSPAAEEAETEDASSDSDESDAIEDDGREGAKAGSKAGPDFEDFEEGVVVGKKVKKPFETANMLWICGSALIAYVVGRGSESAPSTTEEVKSNDEASPTANDEGTSTSDDPNDPPSA